MHCKWAKDQGLSEMEPLHKYNLPYRKKQKPTNVLPKVVHSAVSVTETVTETIVLPGGPSCIHNNSTKNLPFVDSTADSNSDANEPVAVTDPWETTDEAESLAFWGCPEDTETCWGRCKTDQNSTNDNVRSHCPNDVAERYCSYKPMSHSCCIEQPSVAASVGSNEHVNYCDENKSLNSLDDETHGENNKGEQNTVGHHDDSQPRNFMSSDNKILQCTEGSVCYSLCDGDRVDTLTEDMPIAVHDEHENKGNVCVVDDTEDSDVDEQQLQDRPKWQTILTTDPYPLSEHLILSLEEVSILLLQSILIYFFSHIL
jgi:hypothetical protein